MKHLLITTICLVLLLPHVIAAAEEKSEAPIKDTHADALCPNPNVLQASRFSGDIRLCGEKIPYTDPEIKERFEKEMMLMVWNQPQVMLWLKRAHRWFPHIEAVLKQEKLPLDMKYLPIVESALLSHGESYGGAVGFWQFIKSTGQRYGLRIDSQVDERRNMFCATRAACRYLKDLYSRFGSYLLTMSAYNMGEGSLEKAIKSQETRDFFSLYLPLETQRYILRIAAVKLIMSDPEGYGYRLEPQDLYPAFTYSEIKLSPKCVVPISMIAKACDVPFKTIKDYNPQFLGYYLDKGPTTLLVPDGAHRDFLAKFTPLYTALEGKASVPSKSHVLSSKSHVVSSKYHVVKAGENLSSIARKYKISMLGLRRLNKLSKKHVIHPGDELRVQ